MKFLTYSRESRDVIKKLIIPNITHYLCFKRKINELSFNYEDPVRKVYGYYLSDLDVQPNLIKAKFQEIKDNRKTKKTPPIKSTSTPGKYQIMTQSSEDRQKICSQSSITIPLYIEPNDTWGLLENSQPSCSQSSMTIPLSIEPNDTLDLIEDTQQIHSQSSMSTPLNIELDDNFEFDNDLVEFLTIEEIILNYGLNR